MATPNIFNSSSEIKEELQKQQYIAREEIAMIMFLSQELGKPFL